MSSMRNAVQRRSHRERAQPLERQRLGLLEKHKDYSLRAKDYNKKKAQLKSLRQKAAERNEDEFYFGMMSRSGPGSSFSRGKSWSGTINGDRGNKALDVDTVRLLKTQDVGYIRTMQNVAAKEVRLLEERLVLAGGPDVADGAGLGDDDEDEDEGMPARAEARPKKLVFSDDAEEREQMLAHLPSGDDEMADTDEEGEAGEHGEADGRTEVAARRKAANLLKIQRRLQGARRKLKALKDAEHGLEAQRAKMAKTPSYTGITKSGKKVKARERKR